MFFFLTSNLLSVLTNARSKYIGIRYLGNNILVPDILISSIIGNKKDFCNLMIFLYCVLVANHNVFFMNKNDTFPD